MHGEMLIVYLAHPFTGSPPENIERVTRIAKRIISYSHRENISPFYAPVVPHLLLSVYSEESNPGIRHITEELSLALVRASDELWIVSDTISDGMKLEIEAARATDIRVRDWSEVQKLIPDMGQESNFSS